MGNLAFVIEDEENIRELVQCTLESCGIRVLGFETPVPMFAQLQDDIPNVIILDIMLPVMDGLETLRKLKSDAKTAGIPVILLTARSSEIDKVTGLDLGADDYITKPFGVLELMARVKAAIRRSAPPAEPADVLESRGLKLDAAKHEVMLNGEKIDLTLKEFALLRLLMENAGKVIERDTLLDKIWGYGYAGETRTLDMHIRSLRLKLHDGAGNGGFIVTVRGVGYKFSEG